MEQMMEEGSVKKYSWRNWGKCQRPRITQIMNLLHLAPDIQEQILSPDAAQVGLREAAVRKLCSVVQWSEQRIRWQSVLSAGTQEGSALTQG
jgi:hypothetical protein